MTNENSEKNILEVCPHCGHKLSPWQQVLLRVDRTLTCKYCWYRIILDKFDPSPENPKGKEEKNNNEGK